MNQIKITIEREEDDKLEITVPGDMVLYGESTSWESTFRQILKWVSFVDESADELFGGEEE